MRIFLLLAALVAIGPFTGSLAAAADNEPPSGFTALFNGRDLSGWHGMAHVDPRTYAALSEEERAKKAAADMEDAKAHWTAQDGDLVNDGKGVYLTTDQDYGDIELMIDYKTVPLADSGIYLRATPQVQIWDYTKEGGKWAIGADKGSGGLWNNTAGAAGKDPLVMADKPFGEWNRFRIVQVGARTTVYLNDKLVVDNATMENLWERPRPPAKKKPAAETSAQAEATPAPVDLNLAHPLFATGPIQLQTHGGEIRWKNIFIREIGADEANAMLAKISPEGFEPVFNGKNLDGWAGPTENYQVVDGAIACQKGKGGTIYANTELTDFVARVEIKLPPGGNNGLAIRYPGSGDTAYKGMCELQVLDTEAPKYGKIDPRQVHGSAYGMVGARRGYLRPVGEWNFQEVTVQGPTIKVELNGSVILDTDLSKVTEFMANSPHPGKDRTSGFFGFAGHGDAVQFRNVSIKRLDSAAAKSESPSK